MNNADYLGRPAVQPPTDPATRHAIETTARFVARSGPAVEEVTRQRQSSNPRFLFLLHPSGDDHKYYEQCLSIEKYKLSCSRAQQEILDFQISQSAQNLDSHLRQIVSEIGFCDRSSRPRFIADLESKFRLDIDTQSIRSILERAQIDSTTANVEEASSVLYSYLSGKDCQIPIYLSFILVDHAHERDFESVLHLIHVVNDILNKAAINDAGQQIKNLLASVVAPIFMLAALSANEDRSKLGELYDLLEFWKAKSYIRADVLDMIERDIFERTKEDSAAIVREFWIQAIARSDQRYIQLERHHFEFVKHLQRSREQIDSKPKKKSRFSSSKSPKPQYYDYPAGILRSLVKLSNCDYEPIDPAELERISIPTEFSARVQRAYEEFEAKINGGDNNGFESQSLYEFYKTKVEYLEEFRNRSLSTSSTSSSSSSSTASESSSKLQMEISSALAPPLIQQQTASISASNKGHQLLQKMGWTGLGLGKKEQGIVEPISGGEVRELNEKYRGIGLESDPFDQFRKVKSQKYQKLMTDFAIGKRNDELSKK